MTDDTNEADPTMPNDTTDPNDEPLDDRLGDLPSESSFDKEILKKLGERGSGVLEHVQKSTDLDTLDEQVDVTTLSFCTCGHPIVEYDPVRRCVSCDAICCTQCRIRHNRYNYCPQCIRRAFSLTRQVFIALYLLDQNTLDLTDLWDAELIDREPVRIVISDAATTLVEHDYIQTDGTPTPTATTRLPLDTDNPLTAQGKEALHIGEQLYGDDTDIADLQEQLEVQNIANNTR